MITAKGDCLLTSVRMRDVNTLDKMCATLSPQGWVIPDWLRVLRKQVQFNYIVDKTLWLWKEDS